MIKLLNNYKSISLIGMAKNVGKTTTLNYILKKMYHRKRIGLTSIGRDGEELDQVTNTEKPRIYIEKGTIVATTRRCLNNSDFTKKILETTDIHTSLGAVVICEALSDGYVDLAGPSTNSQIKKVIDIFNNYQVELTLIDGAISRKGFAEPFVSKATILATGASYSLDLSKVVFDTLHYVKLLNKKEIKNSDFFKQLINESNISIVDEDFKVKKLAIKTALNSTKEIVQEINQCTKFLLLKGALSNELLKTLIENRSKFENITIVVKDATKCIYDASLTEKLNHSNIDIQVINSTKLLGITFNPTTPYGYSFDELEFKNELEKVINIPIFNVMREDE